MTKKPDLSNDDKALQVTCSLIMDLCDVYRGLPVDPIRQFEGRFLHMGLQWKEHSVNGWGIPAKKLVELLRDQGGYSWSESKFFIDAMIWAIINNKTIELLDAAFGKDVVQYQSV